MRDLLVIGVTLFCSLTTTTAEGPFAKTQKTRKDAVTMGGVLDGLGTYTPIDLNDDPTYKFMRRALGGEDGFSLLGEMFQNSDLDELWKQKDAAKLIVDNIPMFKAVYGVEELFDKGDDFTDEDGLTILNLVRNFFAKASETMSKLTDTQGFANLMRAYAETTDKELTDLYAKVQGGDKDAFFTLQQKILDNEIGAVVDLNKLGLGPNEPEWITNMRQTLFETPILSKYLNEDEATAAIVRDPMNALQTALNLASDQ